MENNIKEAINIIEDVRKSMLECTNKAFLKGAINELNEALEFKQNSNNSLLDDLLNHCDTLIKGNKNSFNNGVYAVRGKISYLKSLLDKSNL